MAADRILVIGDTGSGKTTSLRNLNPLETFIINTIGKKLTFKGWKSKYTEFNSKDNPMGNIYSVSQQDKKPVIAQLMEYVDKKRPDIKTLIIEDFGYVPSYKMFDKVKETGYGKFTEIALDIKELATKADSMRDDLTIVFFIHPEISTNPVSGEKYVTAKISGQMVEKQLNFPGLFEKVLYCKPEIDHKIGKITYGFQTNKTDDLALPCKTPIGMFDEAFIDNDLQLVLDKIKEFDN